MARVSLCLIVRDSEKYIARALASVVKPCGVPRIGGPAFDELVIVDTGSVDRTLEIVESFRAQQEANGGKMIVDRIVWPDSFAVARQHSFDLATGEWRGWIDSDDEAVDFEFVKPTLESLGPEVGAVVLKYNYARDASGRVLTSQIRERFVRWALGWKWIGKVHEHLNLPGYQMPPFKRIDDIYINHLATEEEIRSHGDRNRRMLSLDIKGDPIELSRNRYEVATAIKDAEPKRARELLEAVVGTLPGDAITVFLAHAALVDLDIRDGDQDSAKIHALKMVELSPDARPGYHALAGIYRATGDLANEVRWYSVAFGKPNRDSEALRGDDTAHAIAYIEAICAVGMDPLAKRAAMDGIFREYPHLLSHRVAVEAFSHAQAEYQAASALEYARFMVDHDEPMRADEVHASIPYPLKRDPSLAAHRRRVRDYLRTHGADAHNRTWGPINEEMVRAATEDKRGAFGVYGRSVWLAEQIWRLGWRKVLDIGCADGMVTGYLAHRFPNVEFVGVDPDAPCIEHARKMWGDIPNLRFDHATFDPPHASMEVEELGKWCDGWIASEVMEHVREFFELWRPAKPGILTTPKTQPDFGQPPFDLLEHNRGTSGHLRIYSLAEILSDARASETVTVEDPKNPHWGIVRPSTVGAVIPRLQWFVFVCPSAPWRWGPETPYTRGLTGSEECVVYLAEALARSGHRVTVCNGVLDGGERIVRGVMWTGLDYLNEHDLYDRDGKNTTLVFWRLPVLPEEWKSLPGYRVLWLHDAASQYKSAHDSAWTDFDAIICATDYHARTISEAFPIAKNRVRVLPHGIPYMPTAAKIRGKVVYASSPDRGLERLLRWWPAVKDAAPFASLHVFYGTANMRGAASQMPELVDSADRYDAMLRDAEKFGVVNHGLVAHPELHRHMAEAQVWAYPTDFEEIACLTAMKAQLAGCIPVFSPGGCLRETIPDTEPFWGDVATLDSDEAKSAFVSAMGLALKESSVHRVFPRWDSIAEGWTTISMEVR